MSTLKSQTLTLVAVILVAFIGLADVTAQTAAYPNRPIKLVVPFPPGGGADLTARTLAQKMSESIGQPIVIDNKPGANGSLGDRSRQGGAGWLHDSDHGSRPLSVNPSLYAKLPYDPLKDFSYIGIATDGPYVLVVNPSLNVKTFAELVALAKAKPGTLNYASFGIGSMPQLNLEALNRRMGIDLVHVPYKGAGAGGAGGGGGRSGRHDFSVPAVQGFIKDGRLRALAVGSDKRLRAAARRADARRGRRRRRHADPDVFRVRRSGGNAARDRGEAQRRIEESARRSGHRGEAHGRGSRCRTAARPTR